MIDFERVTTTLAFTVESKPITVTANNTGGFDLTETGRTSQTDRVYSTQDPNVWVDIDQPTEITLEDENGNTITWTLSPP